MKTIVHCSLILSLLSCKTLTRSHEKYDIHADIRLGKRFYSIYLDKSGDGYAVKGTGSFYTTPLVIENSITSGAFKADSIMGLLHILTRLTFDSTIKKSPKGTFPRLEIYYKGAKVYDDTYPRDPSVWDGLRPIIPQLPRGFNPFLTDDYPFD